MSCRRALHCLRYAVQQLLLCRHADVSQHTGAAATIKGPRSSLPGAMLHQTPVFCIQFAAMLLHPRGLQLRMQIHGGGVVAAAPAAGGNCNGCGF